MRSTARNCLAVPLTLLLLVASLALSIDESLMLQAARTLGQPAVDGLIAWQKMHNASGSAPESAKIAVVNRFFNQRIRFLDDAVVWGQNDYWATPLETLAKGAGDCEDFAIAKYFTLLALKVPPSRLRLTYVRAAMNRAARRPSSRIWSSPTTRSPEWNRWFSTIWSNPYSRLPHAPICARYSVSIPKDFGNRRGSRHQQSPLIVCHAGGTCCNAQAARGSSNAAPLRSTAIHRSTFTTAMRLSACH